MLSLAAGKEPIRCCEPVLGDLWVGRGNRIILVDTHMLTFQVCHGYIFKFHSAQAVCIYTSNFKLSSSYKFEHSRRIIHSTISYTISLSVS